MCKATRGDHYSYKDSLKLSDYKVQDVAAASGHSANQASATGTLGTHARRLTQRVSSDSREEAFHIYKAKSWTQRENKIIWRPYSSSLFTLQVGVLLPPGARGQPARVHDVGAHRGGQEQVGRRHQGGTRQRPPARTASAAAAAASLPATRY